MIPSRCIMYPSTFILSLDGQCFGLKGKKCDFFVEIGLYGSSLLNLEAIATLTTNFPCGGLLCEG